MITGRSDYMNKILKQKYIIGLTSFFIILVIRAIYSFCWSDESLYVANIHRLLLGDSFIKDEWNPCMISTYILIPIYKVYTIVVGTTKGIYLFFRIFTILLQFIVSIEIFKYFYKIKKDIVGFSSALFFLIYTRANILGPSYYSLSLIFFTWFTIYFAEKKYFKAGILYAISVLENPYLVIFLILLIVLLIMQKVSVKEVISFIAGGTLILILFLFLFLSRIHITEIKRYLPIWLKYLKRTAGEGRTFLGLISQFIKTFSSKFVLLWGILFVISCIWKCVKFDLSKKNKILSIVAQIIFNFIIIFEMIVGYLKVKNILGGSYIVFALCMTIYIPCIFTNMDKMEREIFIFFSVMSLVLSLAFWYASNNGMDAIGIGFAMYMIPILFAIFCSLEKCKTQNYYLYLKCCTSIVLFLVFCSTFFLRIFAVYRDGRLGECSQRLQKGPAAGLYTTKEHADQYNNVCDVIDTYINNTEQKTEERPTLLVSKLAPWVYVYAETKCDAPTLWRVVINSEDVYSYYTEGNHELPQYCLILNPEYGNFKDNYIVTWGTGGDPVPNSNDSSGWLIEKMQQAGYLEEETACGKIYYKR